MKDMQFTLGDSRTKIIFCDPKSAVAAPSTHSAALWVADKNLVDSFPDLFSDPELARCLEVLPSGEEAKEWAQVMRVLDRSFDLGLARDSCIIGVGGGVLTDLTGFAASVYMRGLKLVLVPTTLLAMVDAALGGKTGMNFASHKNMVGTFYPASEIRISTDFLKTLSNREFLSGLAEVIKAAMLDDANLLDLLEKHRDAVLSRTEAVMEELVFRSIRVKGKIVEADLKESSIRAHLNLGHTFAHALESVSGFGTWTHGAAVAWGIAKALDLGVLLGQTDPCYRDRIRSILLSYGYELRSDADPGRLYTAMTMDKKKAGGKPRFVLQRGLCETFLSEVPQARILEVLEELV